MKKACVSVVGSGQLHEITIQPGTTAGDILHNLNLPDYMLSRNPSADFFADSESVYEKVADGQKLFASTKAIVGSNLLARLRDTVVKYLPIIDVPALTSHRRVLTRTIHPTPIRRRQVPYWIESGWSKTGNAYRGNYQTHYGAFQGFIEERSGHQINSYILEPPKQVLNSSHGPCFQPRGDGWFHVHMSHRPSDVSSAIVAIERLIGESLKGGR